MTVAPGQFRFSAVAAKTADLEKAHWVRVSTDERERLIGFEFLGDPIQPEDANKLRGTGGRSRLCTAKGLINQTPWINAVAAKKRKFKLSQYPRDQKIWVIRLAPWFELSVLPEDIGSIGAGAGIYRYRDSGGEVVYIGKGRIADRFREPARRMWGIARIEYSLVPEEDEQYKWEKFHLDDFGPILLSEGAVLAGCGRSENFRPIGRKNRPVFALCWTFSEPATWSTWQIGRPAVT